MRSELVNKLLRHKWLRYQVPVNRHDPAVLGPVRPSLTEFRRFRARRCRESDDAELPDLCLSVREHDIARYTAPHVVIGFVAVSITLCLRRPNVAAFNFLLIRLFVVDPPESH